MNLNDLIDYACRPPLPSDRSVAIGCIGAGFIMADCHLVAYREHGLNPQAVFSRSLEKAQAVADRHGIPKATDNWRTILDDDSIPVLDVALPPDQQLAVIREAAKRPHVRGILAQKPLGMNLAEAQEAVALCEAAGITLAVNQNMRYDQSVRAAAKLLEDGALGDPVLATIDMRAIPHWMPWQEAMGWLTCRIMSIHHLDCFRYWLGNPETVYASFTKDPRTLFDHTDGVCLYLLEFANGARASSWDDVWTGPAREGAAADIGITWRIEGTKGTAIGTIGWPSYPERTPSTIRYTTTEDGQWHEPQWDKVWFPDAFIGPMAELLCALEEGRESVISGRNNLHTMALVDAAYESAHSKRAVRPDDLLLKK